MSSGQQASYDNAMKFATSGFTWDYLSYGTVTLGGWNAYTQGVNVYLSSFQMLDKYGQRPTIVDEMLYFNEGQPDADFINLKTRGTGSIQKPNFQNDLIFKLWIIDGYEDN